MIDLRTDVSEVAVRVASIEGFLEGRGGRRRSLEAPGSAGTVRETPDSPSNTRTGR